MARKPSPVIVIRERIISPIKKFIKDSRSIGITLICCTVVSLFLSNSPWSGSYLSFWGKEISIPFPSLHLPHSVLHLINDGLMAVFFLLVGMEIKRELMIGELSSFKKALMPVIAAIGGMVVPAFIYFLWCGDTPYKHGWGIPMATDIAFSLGILSLVGKKAPLSLKIFLMALAIIDDLGGILTIAVFYAGNINWSYIALAGIIFTGLILLNLFKVHKYYLYFIPGLFLWYFVYNSGIHATIAGVLLAFTIPLKRIHKLEHALHDPVNFIILPLFALANTTIVIPGNFLAVFGSPVHHGVFMGLLLGKPLGILLVCFLAVKAGIAALPEDISWKHLLGMGLIAGIGFTMSIFIATLAFEQPEVLLIAKLAIIGASLIAGLAGLVYLNMSGHVKQKSLQQKTTGS